jgi:transcriptional regulator with XRE-family HTH domain
LRLTQAELAHRVGIGPSRIGQLEHGDGERAPLGLWVALALAIGRPLAISLTPTVTPDRTTDAAHLEIQEFLLALARRTGRTATFELPTRPAEPCARPTSAFVTTPTGS